MEARFKIIRFLFGELPMVELAQLHAQLRQCLDEGCLDCQQEWEATELLVTYLRASHYSEPVPEGLRERVYRKLAENL